MTSAPTYTELAQKLIAVKLAQKEVESKRDEMLHPVKELQKKAKEWFGPPSQELEQLEAELKEQLVKYIDHAVATAQIEAKAAIQRGDMTTALMHMSAIPNVDGIRLSTVVGFVIEDESKIPDHFFKRELDSKAVLTTLRQGGSIPGVEKTTETRIAIHLPKGAE